MRCVVLAIGLFFLCGFSAGASASEQLARHGALINGDLKEFLFQSVGRPESLTGTAEEKRKLIADAALLLAILNFKTLPVGFNAEQDNKLVEYYLWQALGDRGHLGACEILGQFLYARCTRTASREADCKASLQQQGDRCRVLPVRWEGDLATCDATLGTGVIECPLPWPELLDGNRVQVTILSTDDVKKHGIDAEVDAKSRSLILTPGSGASAGDIRIPLQAESMNFKSEVLDVLVSLSEPEPERLVFAVLPESVGSDGWNLHDQLARQVEFSSVAVNNDREAVTELFRSGNKVPTGLLWASTLFAGDGGWSIDANSVHERLGLSVPVLELIALRLRSAQTSELPTRYGLVGTNQSNTAKAFLELVQPKGGDLTRAESPDTKDKELTFYGNLHDALRGLGEQDVNEVFLLLTRQDISYVRKKIEDWRQLVNLELHTVDNENAPLGWKTVPVSELGSNGVDAPTTLATEVWWVTFNFNDPDRCRKLISAMDKRLVEELFPRLAHPARQGIAIGKTAADRSLFWSDLEELGWRNSECSEVPW